MSVRQTFALGEDQKRLNSDFHADGEAPSGRDAVPAPALLMVLFYVVNGSAPSAPAGAPARGLHVMGG